MDSRSHGSSNEAGTGRDSSLSANAAATMDPVAPSMARSDRTVRMSLDEMPRVEHVPESVQAGPETAVANAVQPDGQLSRDEMADIFDAFNSVTDRLQNAHVALQAEVARLKRELRETNEQLRRSRQLAALGQMAAGIAHELRNPLGGIRLYTGMLADDLAGQPGPYGLVRKIDHAVTDLDAVIADVLTFSRDINCRPYPVRLSDLITQAIESCTGLLHGSRVEIHRADLENTSETTVPTGGGPIPPVNVDPILMNQVLGNVIRNAVEAMEGHGTLTFEVERMVENPVDGPPVSASGSHVDYVGLTVRDTGPGVDESALGTVFNPFFTTRSSGTGLGLAIAHRIVDAHGGGIAITNAPAGGAEVRVWLPATPEAERQPTHE